MQCNSYEDFRKLLVRKTRPGQQITSDFFHMIVPEEQRKTLARNFGGWTSRLLAEGVMENTYGRTTSVRPEAKGRMINVYRRKRIG